MNVEHLSHAECRDLLRHCRLGRVIYTADAMPAVTVVPYEMVDNAVVFAVSDDMTIAPDGRRDIIAFEIDDAGPDDGWSVVVIGRAAEMSGRTPRSIRLDCTLFKGRQWRTDREKAPMSQELQSRSLLWARPFPSD